MNSYDKNFENVFSILLPQKEEAISLAIRGQGAAPPIYFGSKDIPPPAPADVAEFFHPKDAWKASSEYYAGTESSLSPLYVKIAAKAQNDYLGQIEREYRMLNCSAIQAQTNEASLRYRNSKAGGALINVLLQRIRSFNEVTDAAKQ